MQTCFLSQPTSPVGLVGRMDRLGHRTPDSNPCIAHPGHGESRPKSVGRKKLPTKKTRGLCLFFVFFILKNNFRPLSGSWKISVARARRLERVGAPGPRWPWACLGLARWRFAFGVGVVCLLNVFLPLKTFFELPSPGLGPCLGRLGIGHWG